MMQFVENELNNYLKGGKDEKKKLVYTDRIAYRDCHHRYSGSNAATRPATGTAKGIQHFLHQ